MKNILAAIFIFAISTSCFASFHNAFLQDKQKDVGYFVFPGIGGAHDSSCINFDAALDPNTALELSNWGSNTYTSYSTSSLNLLQLLFKQRLVDGEHYSFVSALGIGALYSSGNASVCLNAGGILGIKMFSGIRFSAPFIVSLLSDGAIVDYSAGFSKTFFKGAELVLGGKGILLALVGSRALGLNNALYMMAGLRIVF